MARSINNPLFFGVSGKLGNAFVIKQYRNGPVLSNRPDMSGITPSEAQLEKRRRFKNAVAYAKAVQNDPERRAVYEQNLGKYQSVFLAALAEHMRSGK